MQYDKLKQAINPKNKEFFRVYSDGCYDCLHFGHMNGFRQIKERSEFLIVGTHSGEDIAKEKYKTVMNDCERYEMLKHIRWIDCIQTQVPFVCSVERVKNFGIEKVFHGNDIILNADGFDCYGEIKKAKMFIEFERTLFMSSSALVERMLERTYNCEIEVSSEKKAYLENLKILFKKNDVIKKGKIVYVDGSFDILHVGNASFLEKAKKMGDYLIVGLHSSYDIIKEKNVSPIQTTLEREITLLGIKHVDEVVTGAPFYPLDNLMTKLGINIVVFAKEHNKKYYNNLSVVEVVKVQSDFDYLCSGLIIKRAHEVAKSKKKAK
ncbi:putative ethanolamine-phosphate cytidylyltransferase [Cucumispora dikerogammari]|nr:putative ethanolamine-phosphate cytidylyltransferase [Cucumispora dikerogammari]